MLDKEEVESLVGDNKKYFILVDFWWELQVECWNYYIVNKMKQHGCENDVNGSVRESVGSPHLGEFIH